MSSGKSEATLTIDGAPVPVLIRRYVRARGYRLRYDAGNRRLLLSVPARGALKPALFWAQTQEEWVRAQMRKAPDALLLKPGAVVPVEGVERRIHWDRSFPRLPRLTGDAVQVGGPEDQVGARVLRWLRAHALATLTRETQEIAARENLRVTSIRTGDPRSRWGSCTVDGAIRYSWRLILAPPEVRRATVAHEVAHLLHMDHSPAFHAAHARLLGQDPAPARHWLRTHGTALHRIGA
ncbi:MAG: metal-dependent hydrolase [Sphingobium sp. 32-64-5]|nr:MAG: metal-dependent hydrolase [Sphingobium sp. 32-64-5]